MDERIYFSISNGDFMWFLLLLLLLYLLKFFFSLCCWHNFMLIRLDLRDLLVNCTKSNFVLLWLKWTNNALLLLFFFFCLRHFERERKQNGFFFTYSVIVDFGFSLMHRNVWSSSNHTATVSASASAKMIFCFSMCTFSAIIVLIFFFIRLICIFFIFDNLFLRFKLYFFSSSSKYH